MGFPRQEYWSGLPFPSPGDLSDPGIEPGSPKLQVNSLPSDPKSQTQNTHPVSVHVRKLNIMMSQSPILRPFLATNPHNLTVLTSVLTSNLITLY